MKELNFDSDLLIQNVSMFVNQFKGYIELFAQRRGACGK
jgi:hypothetical protein